MWSLLFLCQNLAEKCVYEFSSFKESGSTIMCEKAKVLKGCARCILVYNSTELKSLFFSACHRPHRVVQEAPFSPSQEESRTQLHLYSVKTEADRIIQVTFAMTRVH